MQNEKIHFSTCNLCEAMCGIEVRVREGEITRIAGDKADPFSKGHICPKAAALADLYADPDRLKHPLKRTDAGWKEISWEDAYDETAENILRIRERHGRDSIATYLGNPTVHNTEAVLYGILLREVLGSRNNFSATSLDQLPHMLASLRMFGSVYNFNVPDIDRVDYLIILGANPLVSNGSLMTAPDVRGRLKAVKERAGKIVVVDPRRTETADFAGNHFFIRPGTDALFLMALLNVIYGEGLIRPGRLARFTDGIEDWSELSRSFSPEFAENHTGIPAARIREIAREFAAAKSAALYPRLGVSAHEFGGLIHFLVNVINIVTGNLDRPGGMMFPTPAVDTADILARLGRNGSYNTYQSRVSGAPEFWGELPAAVMAEEMNTPGPGRVRALFTNAGNPVLSSPNGRALDRALGELEFMVSVDIYLNETTRHANIILPPRSGLETAHFDLIFPMLAVRNTVKYAPPVMPAGENTRSDAEIFSEILARLNPVGSLNPLTRELSRMTMRGLLDTDRIIDTGIRMGPYGDRFNPFSDGLNLKRVRENPHGLDLGPLKPRLPEILRTKNKRIQLVQDIYTADLERLKQRFADEDRTEFLLIGRRILRSNNSWMHNSERLTKGASDCVLFMHPLDAERLGFESGGWVNVKSRVGEIRAELRVNDGIMPGVVSLPHGFGHDREGVQLRVATNRRGVSINDITDADLRDPLAGTAVLNGIPVELSAAPEPESIAGSQSFRQANSAAAETA